MADRALAPGIRLVMDGIALVYVVAIAVAAQFTCWCYLLFPELGAMSHDVLTRPWGKWASQPVRLVVTPALGAAIGTWITREFPYSVLTIELIVILCLLLIALLKSNIAPAMSAGVLPLVLGIKNWLYPASIVLGLVALVCIFLPWRWYYRRKHQGAAEDSNTDLNDVLETPATQKMWILPYFLFLTAMASCAAASGLRFILFPPLIVIAYEMFAHPTTCPWAGKPLAVPVACILTSLAGLLAVTSLRSDGIAAGFSMVFGIVVLRLLNIHMPPALAVGLLPLIIDDPTIKYPVSVGIGAGVLTLAFLIYRRWIIGNGALNNNDSMK